MIKKRSRKPKIEVLIINSVIKTLNFKGTKMIFNYYRDDGTLGQAHILLSDIIKSIKYL